MLENARHTGIPASVSHHKAMMRRNWGKPSETTRKTERARAEGLEVICDFYPWVISATSNLAGRFGGALGSLNPALKGIAEECANLLAVLEDDSGYDPVWWTY